MHRRNGGFNRPSHHENTAVTSRHHINNSNNNKGRTSNSAGRNYIWVRTELVDAIYSNHGSLPRHWKPSRKRGRDATSWGWLRAYVVSSDTSTSRAASPHRLRGGAAQANQRSVLATITVDDLELAPSQLINATVSFSYDSNDQGTVCNANTWWNSKRDPQPPPDLTTLTHLHEPSVVYCLLKRYQQHQIYTYTGKILLALNPFRILEGIYGEEVMQDYYLGTDALERPPPHVYAIAQDAYQTMLQFGQDQSILVSGESGSGKTVTTKIIMGYLASQSQRNGAMSIRSSFSQSKDHEDDDGDDPPPSIETQILQSNPILESFGNARTVRNDNSSRFGKFMELLFTSSGTLVSASIETYLLEKIRLISQAPGERNYHVFYELLAGVSQAERQALQIANVTANDFRMTAMSGTMTRRDGVDDRETYLDLRDALGTVGFSREDQQSLLSVACALLHTSNIDFKPTAGEGSELVPSQSLRCALSLLGVPMEALNNALCLCAIEARGETFHKNMSMSQATKALEALIKATYGALFTHIVQQINQSITVEQNPDAYVEQLTRIGVLDIFGFESFDSNSFEQLCINYCNEALQQQFNRFVFKLEQEEYNREGIEWSFIEFPDNQDILDLIEKKREGILSLLDEQCRLASCTDASFCRVIYDKCSAHSRFTATNTQKVSLTFSIHHYAGMVTYDSINFLEKNKDELPKETTELLTSSSVPFLAYLGELLSNGQPTGGNVSPLGAKLQRSPSPTSSVSSYTGSLQANRISPSKGTSPNKKQFHRSSSSMIRESVGGQFSRQLRELRGRIDATTPHYVRCLKPNDDLVADRFEAHIIADQLRCAGVLEAIRVSRVGFPHRFFHDNFIQRYEILATPQTKRGWRQQDRDRCINLMGSLVPKVLDTLKREGNQTTERALHDEVALGMQMGHNKVFLRRRVFESLEYLRNVKLGRSAVVIQKNVRRCLAQLQYYDSYMAVIALQCFARRVIAVGRFYRLRTFTAVTRIQSSWRKFYAETGLMAARLIAHFCQAHRRGAIARKLYAIMRVEHQALLIQRCWRSFIMRDWFWRKKRAAILIQCYWRRRIARKEFRQLRLKARDLGAVAAERDRFKEESLRLRREVEMLKTGSSGFSRKGSSADEVEQLRRQVERLQAVLAQGQGGSLAAYDDKNNMVIETSSQGWLGGIFGRGDDASQVSANSFSPMPVIKRAFSRNESAIESPVFERETPTQTTPSSAQAKGFSPGMSTSSTSLLDAEGDQGLPGLVGFHGMHGSSLDQTPRHRDVTGYSPDRNNDSADFVDVQNGLLETIGVSRNPEYEGLVEAIRRRDLRRINGLLRESKQPYILINDIGENSRTPLHVAVALDDTSVARVLIESGAIANAQDNDGETALHLSIGPPMTKLLLETGHANTNIPNIDGVCPLHVAVQRGDAGSVRLLLKYGAKVDTADNIRWFTPLHLAALPDRLGESAYFEARVRSRASIAELLCTGSESSKPDLNYLDHEGNAPLHYAVQIETPEACQVVNTLLENGADPKLSNARNQQPLLLLCHNSALRDDISYQDCLHSMLFHGANPNQQSNTGCTPLHLSLFHKDIDSAVQLVNRGSELHLLWNKPKRWVAFWDEMGSTEVLALDMVQEEHALHRILAAITRPPKLAPVRTWCMHCKTPMGSFARALHCQHCGRHICSACSRCTLAPDYFPKSFEIYQASWVCLVCEKILVARREDSSSNTHPISSIADDDDDRYL